MLTGIRKHLVIRLHPSGKRGRVRRPSPSSKSRGRSPVRFASTLVILVIGSRPPKRECAAVRASDWPPTRSIEIVSVPPRGQPYVLCMRIRRLRKVPRGYILLDGVSCGWQTRLSLTSLTFYLSAYDKIHDVSSGHGHSTTHHDSNQGQQPTQPLMMAFMDERRETSCEGLTEP
ncbi:hypothetical protein LZ30DRAFT_216764 [Colletotrichum cereale]|nr:hypothetical protein LZ30DRAFT_216764 [Colletotrichum cereale]